MDEDIKKAYMAELHTEQQVRVGVTLKMEGCPRTVDSDDNTETEEVLMIITDLECKLLNIIRELEKTDRMGRKLEEAGMQKLGVGVPMRGEIVKLTAKSAAKDKRMASQEIRHLHGF